ncbi:MAG: antitoxin [Elusimicrobia bacterium]|nr:antitoxin [Elusimicrobiota bacterium]
MQTKLTLRLEKNLISQAKSYAKKRGKSISRIVADYFKALGGPSAKSRAALTPIVCSLKGSLRGANVVADDMHRRWEEKHL